MIKQALADEFGWENVSVRNKGKWIKITIKFPVGHLEDYDYEGLIDELKAEVWEILIDTGLIKLIPTFQDEVGYTYYALDVQVKLEEGQK